MEQSFFKARVYNFILDRKEITMTNDKEGKCSKTGIKYSDAINELQEIFADCDLYGAKAKHPTSIRVRVLGEAVIEAARLYAAQTSATPVDLIDPLAATPDGLVSE